MHLHINLASAGAINSSRSRTIHCIALPDLTTLAPIIRVPPEDSHGVHNRARTASCGRINGAIVPREDLLLGIVAPVGELGGRVAQPVAVVRVDDVGGGAGGQDGCC